MSNLKPLISVIVPVYKVEKYLNRCIDSIICQTYDNLEIILVDDESLDRCGEICDEYAAQDSRIKVIHQENGGLSAARNVGLDICKGDYIAFVDSDDYVDIDMIKSLYLGVEGADFCGCGFVHETSDGSILSIHGPETNVSFDGNTILRQHYSGLNGRIGISAVYVWGKLYRKELFEQLRFQKGLLFEDIHLMPYLLSRCSNACFLPYSGYHYMLNANSITNNKSADHMRKCYEDSFAIWDDHKKLYHESGRDDLYTEVNCLILDKIMTTALKDKIPEEYIKWSKQQFRKVLQQLMDKPIGISRKLRYIAFGILGKSGYKLLQKIIKG